MPLVDWNLAGKPVHVRDAEVVEVTEAGRVATPDHAAGARGERPELWIKGVFGWTARRHMAARGRPCRGSEALFS